MTTPSNQAQAAPRFANQGFGPLPRGRYDTRGCDLTALTPSRPSPPRQAPPRHGHDEATTHSHRNTSFWRESLALMEQHVSFARRKVRAGECVYQCGDAFGKLHLVSAGLFKIVNLTADGREQPSGLFFKGDWLGFDGIPTGQHGCTAVALDDGEVWTIHYDDLLQASAKTPLLLRLVMAALSAQLERNRNTALAMGTLPADSRVADFLLQWAYSLQERGLRTDQIHVNMSRADIGKFLALRLETVSRALSRLAQCGLIEFNERGRREITIPNLAALADFIQSGFEAPARVLQ